MPLNNHPLSVARQITLPLVGYVALSILTATHPVLHEWVLLPRVLAGVEA
jgi:hypothetical protein